MTSLKTAAGRGLIFLGIILLIIGLSAFFLEFVDLWNFIVEHRTGFVGAFFAGIGALYNILYKQEAERIAASQQSTEQTSPPVEPNPL